MNKDTCIADKVFPRKTKFCCLLEIAQKRTEKHSILWRILFSSLLFSVWVFAMWKLLQQDYSGQFICAFLWSSIAVKLIKGDMDIIALFWEYANLCYAFFVHLHLSKYRFCWCRNKPKKCQFFKIWFDKYWICLDSDLFLRSSVYLFSSDV